MVYSASMVKALDAGKPATDFFTDQLLYVVFGAACALFLWKVVPYRFWVGPIVWAVWADAVCVTYECSAESLGATAPVTVTGNPVRRSVIEADRAAGRAMFDLAEDDFMLLVFGGSLGARHINEAVVALKDELLARPNLHIVHITGPKELDAVTEALALTDDEARRWHLLGYQDRMGETLAAADAIVSRAGATSLAEISALAIPALLVPYPFATADHQTTHARAWVESGAAFMMPDDELGSDEFNAKLFALIDDASVRESMVAAARAQKTGEAAAALADVVVGVATAR